MADLPKEPLTRQEMYLSRLAGENTTLPIEPLTREEMYLEGAIGRVEAVEEELEELENNPDVADIVATYADLLAYDTTHLTDKDIIRVLQDETHNNDSTYYRYSKSDGTFSYVGDSKQYTDFVGTDGVTAGSNGLVPAPATTDAGKFLKADGTWAAAGGGGGEPDYSETEVSTGVKWIDGKTIYKKSFQQTITVNSGAVTFNLNITNLYEIVKIDAVWHLGGTLTNGLPTTFASLGSINENISVITYGGQAEIASNGRKNTKGVITFYYTKSV